MAQRIFRRLFDTARSATPAPARPDGVLNGTARLAGGAAVLGAVALAAGAWWLRRGDSLDGEVAVVTGGSRGLGYLIARELLAQGCRVVICGRDAPTVERALVRLRQETGGEVEGWSCDVGDRDAVDLLMGRILARFGRIDIVVNNAGIIQVGPLEAMTIEDYRSTLDTDYWGAVHTTLAVLPHMRARGSGRIVNITSIAAAVPVPHLAPYNAAKHAKLGFSDSLRMEVAGDGIAVTTVIPGLMRTGSPVHVEFRGQPEKEYAWFVLGSILPLTTMSAERAAARIVRAIRRREARLTLSWQARVLRAIHDVAPAATTRGMTLANHLMPGPNGAGRSPRDRGDAAEGLALRGTLPAPVEWALERAAERTNQ
jgi:NAD(P)-dependent dehydrogenase (short-subunit alcohol dehydrogenase family)